MSTSVTVRVNSEEPGVLGMNKNCEMREDLQEKQSNYRAEFEKVKAPPEPTKQQWWRPDPETGMWIPEDYEGRITTSTSNNSPQQFRLRRGTSASLDERRWWTSLDELPDMYRASSSEAH